MKKLNKLLNFLLFCLCLYGNLSCSERRAYDNRFPSKDSAYADSANTAYESLSPRFKALSIAQDFVKQEFATNSEFDNEGTIIEETSVPDRFKILQKFTAEDHPSGYSTFIYRIWVQRFDDGTWDFGNLTVESITGETVFITNGAMKARERNDGVGDIITAGGIEFHIAERSPSSIRIYSKNKLGKAKLRSAIKDLKDKYEIIMFSTEAKHERGDEYATWSSNIYCNFDINEVISEEEFFK